MQHLRAFALSIGKRYQDLEPNADLVSANKNPVIRGYEGWAYAARTPGKNILPGVFRKRLSIMLPDFPGDNDWGLRLIYPGLI